MQIVAGSIDRMTNLNLINEVILRLSNNLKHS